MSGHVVLPTFERADWMVDAACAGGELAQFFPSRGRSSAAEAKAICRSCPVQRDCLDYALRNRIHHGVWGGESERGRARMRRQRRAA